MARIRSIHPGYTTDEAFMTMSMAAKAAWPALWTEADDAGVFEWKPVVLKARIFPADNVDFASVLDEYRGIGCVEKREIDGKSYGYIRNFGKWQRPKHPSFRHPLPEDMQLFVMFSGNEVAPTAPVSPKVVKPPPKVVKTTENRPQMEEVEEGRREKKEKEDSEPNGSGGASPPFDARADLFGPKRTMLQAITGKRDGQCRSIIGRWLKTARDDAAAVGAAIEQAQRDRIADPIPWIEARLKRGPPGRTVQNDDEIYRNVL